MVIHGPVDVEEGLTLRVGSYNLRWTLVIKFDDPHPQTVTSDSDTDAVHHGAYTTRNDVEGPLPFGECPRRKYPTCTSNES